MSKENIRPSSTPNQPVAARDRRSRLEAPNALAPNVSFSVAIPSDQPIFLFASSQRCGSTLLQRLLNSCPDILVWGEHAGYLKRFIQDFQILLDWESRFASHRQSFLPKGYDQFISNMVPEEHEFKQAAIMHIVALFGIPAAKLGRPVWGFKEVRYDAHIALYLQSCFPNARFIHLTRNIVDCFISLKHWEDSPDNPWTRDWTNLAINNWWQINSSFLKKGAEISKLLSVRYEDVVAEPGRFTQELARFLELPVDSFKQRRVFRRRIHEPGLAGIAARPTILPSNLSDAEKALLSQPDIIETAAKYGYKVEF